MVDYSVDEDAETDETGISSSKKRKLKPNPKSPQKKKQLTTWTKDELYGATGVQKIKKYLYTRLRFSTLEYVVGKIFHTYMFTCFQLHRCKVGIGNGGTRATLFSRMEN